MSIQTIVSRLSKKVGTYEVVKSIITSNSRSKDKDILKGIYINDDGVMEIQGENGMELELTIDKNLVCVDKNNYIKIYNRNILVLIRPLNMKNI